MTDGRPSQGALARVYYEGSKELALISFEHKTDVSGCLGGLCTVGPDMISEGYGKWFDEDGVIL
jgi:hypothetical protein